MLERTLRRVGVATAPTHHGEILQGAFVDASRLRRGLVTLPCSVGEVSATFRPSDGGPITVSPAWKQKARCAAELALEALRSTSGSPLGGHLELTGDVPVGRGFGSSTSDVLAAIRSVRDACGGVLSSAQVARLAVRAEVAADPTMHDTSAVLFAHREGEVIEDFGRPLPPIRVLGFGTGVGAVDTLGLRPARYTPAELGRFAELRLMLRTAVRGGDVALLGEVASASTRINQRTLPIPRLARIEAVAAHTGAAGVQTAHSGNVAGLVFDPDLPDHEDRIAEAARLLRAAGTTEFWTLTCEAS